MQVTHPFDTLIPAWVKLSGCSQSPSAGSRVRVAGATHVVPSRVQHYRSLVVGKVVPLSCRPVDSAYKNVDAVELANSMGTRICG
jgi:hypothetical protein